MKTVSMELANKCETPLMYFLGGRFLSRSLRWPSKSHPISIEGLSGWPWGIRCFVFLFPDSFFVFFISFPLLFGSPSGVFWCHFLSFLNFFFNVDLLLRETETECEWVRGRHRVRHRIRNRLQAPSCQHRARRGARTHEPWDHDLSQSQTLNWATQAPLSFTY